ncbi:uncharacterized protein [Watersipora subatra]|uniref:uncharacterized protein n=1 Tax=Watersipora subatra TaxID=2589382 RepID=UPI00355B887D
MCNETSTSAVTSATSHCSSSVADVSDMLHQYKCGFPNSLSGEGWSSSVPRINSYIASLPSPNPGVEKESASSQYTGSEASWSSVAAQQYRAAPPSKHAAAPNLRSTKSSENAARNRLSLPTPRTQSMFDLRQGDGGISKETLYMMEQAEKLRLLKELAKSERKYCGDLWQLTQNYGRLLYSTGALTHRDALQLFPGHLSEMYQLHSSFLRSLNKKIAVWKLNDTCCYGNILSKLTNNTRVDMFALYKDYIERFPGSARILSNASRDSPLLHRVLNKSKLQGGGVGSSKDLMQLLVQPIKMLPLYLSFLKEALYYTGVENSDRCYLQSSADSLDRFLRGNQKSINTCFKLSDAYLAGSHKSRDLGGRSRQGSVSGSTRGSNADSGIESHTDSPRTRRSRRPHTKASGSVDQSAYKRYGLLPKPDPYNHNTSWSAYFHGKDASGRSLQRYNSLRCVHPRDLPFYENVDKMRRGHSDAKTKSRTPTGKQREQNRSNRVQSSIDDEAYPGMF